MKSNRKFTPFSYLLQLGNEDYSDTAPSFLVTLEGQLSIIVPELTTTSGIRKPSQYVDVPINNITRVEIQEVPENTPTSSAESYVIAVIVHLVKIKDYTMFVNAAAQSYPFLCLAFDDRNVADTLRHLILGLQEQMKTGDGGLSGSEKPPDGSETIESDDQQYISPTPVQRNIPRRKIRGDWSLADLAEGFVPNDGTISMVGDGTKLGLLTTAISPHPTVDENTPLYGVVPPGQEQLRNSNHPPRHGMEIHGRVSQTGREIPREGKLFRTLEAEPTGISAIQGTRSPLDTVAISSAQWRDEVIAVDNAPELASQIHDFRCTASSLSQPGDTGISRQAEVETISPMKSRQLQIINPNLNKELSDTTAVDRGRYNIVSSPTQVMGSTSNRKRKASKVSKRLLNRDGEQIEPIGTDNETTRPKKYSKFAKRDPINDNDMPTKQNSSKKKITYTTTSKPANRLDRVSHDAELSDLPGKEDVFAIPDSPTRPSKPSVKTKQTKAAVKRAKSTKSKSVSKPAKVKPALGVAIVPVPKKASASKHARAPPKGADVQENIQDSEARIGGDHRGIHQGEESDEGVEENPLITINNENRSARMSKKSPKQVAGGVSKDLISITKTNEPSITEISDRNTAIASISRNPDQAAPRRQLPKRMAAVHANQKLQGLKAEGALIDTDEKLDYNGITPESRVHVRRSDKARQNPHRSALEAGASLLTTTQLSTVHKTDKHRLEQLPTNRTMAPSKVLPHAEDNVERYNSTIGNPRNPLLTTSSHVSGHSIRRTDDNFQEPDQTQEIDINKPLVPSIEPRSPEESVDLITSCKTTHTSEGTVEKHFEQALGFTVGDDEISFADTFHEHESEVPIVGQQPQLQNLETPSNLEAGRLFVIDQCSHPTAFPRVNPIPMTTPTLMPPSITNASSRTRTVQSSSTKVASDGRKSKTALSVHDITAVLPQLQHVEIQTSDNSSGLIRPAQDHRNIVKPADSVQDAILDTKPIFHETAGEKDKETKTAIELRLEEQRSTPYATGPFCERPRAIIDDKICDTVTIQGLADATVSQLASELIEITSSVVASSEEDSGIAQIWSNSRHKKEQVSSKRKSAGLAGSVNKKIRADKITELPKHHDTPAKPVEETIGHESINVIATDDRVQRKPVIIGFNSNGPRNQGISSVHKPHAETQLSVPKAPILTKVQSSSRKRKHIEEHQTIAHSVGLQRAEDVPIKKLRSTITAVPPTPQVSEKLKVQISTAFQNPIVRQLSSQRSRVQENGSPAPTRSQASRVDSANISHVTDNIVGNLVNDNSVDMDFDRGTVKRMDWGHNFAREINLPPKKPLSFQKQLSSILKGIHEPSSKVGKSLPSSPSAMPWISADMANYYEQTDGKLVNFEMEDVVQVARISDPFTDMNQNQTNSFIEMLRATSGGGKGNKKPNPEDIDFTLHNEGVKYINPIDADKTLVEPERRHRPRNTPSSGADSSSSHSSDSKGQRGRSRSSSSETGGQRIEAERKWREALQPHQKRHCNSLSEMSNVSSDPSPSRASLTI